MADATERFWAKVNKTATCWPWTASTDGHGYGLFRVEGRPFKAHRWSYEQANGPIPDGLQLDHTCHNTDPTCPGGSSCQHRRCVNPAHLEPVTNRENGLRGKTLSASNVAKTHCPQGHPYDEANTWVSRDGRHRICRACTRKRVRRYGRR